MKCTMTHWLRKATLFYLSGLLVFPLLMGCEAGKQSAAISIDEAKLSIASARKAKAEVYSKTVLMNAEEALRQAEKKFKGANFAAARQKAEKSTRLAQEAESEAQRKASERKSKKRAKKA